MLTEFSNLKAKIKRKIFRNFPIKLKNSTEQKAGTEIENQTSLSVKKKKKTSKIVCIVGIPNGIR